ncbi:MAG: propionyl-CoA synthetase [Candidatus Azotimanducaceae bacterium]
MNYQLEYSRSLADPVEFWRQQAGLIYWYRAPQQILSQDSQGADRWFADGQLNTSYLALDYHIDQGRGENIALIYDSPVTDTVEKFSFLALRDKVACFAGALLEQGVRQGDVIIIYMPMIPEALIAMLACARIGAVHSVVFGGFAAMELASRIDDAKPRLIIAASCGIEFSTIIPYKPLIDAARSLALHTVDSCIILQRPQAVAELQAGDLDWQSLIATAHPADCVWLAATDPLYILYTSGTTGKPKGVVRDQGGHAVALRYSMQAVYDVGPGDVFWAASDVGWVVGHSYIVYAPLLTGCTTVLFEGKPVRTPDAGTFWRVIEQHRVNVFFTAPTAFRAIRKEDPDCLLLAKYDVSSLTALFVAGERTDPPTYDWLRLNLKIPVIDHWWQTETGWPVAANLMGLEPLPTVAGSASFPVPGFDVQILSPEHTALGADEEGDVVIKLPLPPGCLTTVWGDHSRYEDAYLRLHPGYYHTGDGGYFDANGYLFIMGRTDDVINVAGHRLSTGEMEEIVAAHSAIAECAVIGVADPEKGQLPVGLLILKDGVQISPSQLEEEVVLMVRQAIGAFANFKRAVVVSRLPKTRSGKILRQIMRKIADEVPYESPATIDDPLILSEIREVMVQGKIGRVAG